MRTWRAERERRIREALARLPGKIGYASEIADEAGLEPWRTNKDLQRMARRGRGVHTIPGGARWMFDRS